MCVVMVTDKSTVSAGFKANYQVIELGMKTKGSSLGSKQAEIKKLNALKLKNRTLTISNRPILTVRFLPTVHFTRETVHFQSNDP